MTVSGKPYTIRRLSCHTKPSPSNLNRPYGRVSFVACIFAKPFCAGCRRCKPQASRLRQPCNFTFPVSLPFPASGRLNLSDAGVVVFQG
ncbi:hypothetical protein FD684_00230 [Neisseria meningitidis]|nr:hypothetical protein [Neisseria meningitidis]MBG8771035.1 hypothetical protein [Neisseria meningitidis]TRD15049.1 hypothetical protein FD684_00230 [Neisseria meningitidis]TRD29323.1 hypothetical protein FD860_00445 [Neisseria meningitidis]